MLDRRQLFTNVGNAVAAFAAFSIAGCGQKREEILDAQISAVTPGRTEKELTIAIAVGPDEDHTYSVEKSDWLKAGLAVGRQFRMVPTERPGLYEVAECPGVYLHSGKVSRSEYPAATVWCEHRSVTLKNVRNGTYKVGDTTVTVGNVSSGGGVVYPPAAFGMGGK